LGRDPHCENNGSSLAGLSSVIAMWGVDFGDCDHQTVLTQPDLFLWGFLVERACGHDPRSVEELKHKNEQAVSGIDQ
jgi:hypothetical protein